MFSRPWWARPRRQRSSASSEISEEKKTACNKDEGTRKRCISFFLKKKKERRRKKKEGKKEEEEGEKTSSKDAGTRKRWISIKYYNMGLKINIAKMRERGRGGAEDILSISPFAAPWPSLAGICNVHKQTRFTSFHRAPLPAATLWMYAVVIAVYACSKKRPFLILLKKAKFRVEMVFPSGKSN